MPRLKRHTVNQLHKLLGQIIEQGDGRLPICVHKTTFQDNCEEDGAVILPVSGCRVEMVLQGDEDGGVKTTKQGRECYRRTAVLFGTSGDGERGFLSADSVERYIREELEWSADAPDIHKTLVAGNIRAFATYLRSMFQD
jgi:hypothetical protein